MFKTLAGILCLLASSEVYARVIHIENKCDFTLWPGWQGTSGTPQGGGARLDKGKSIDVVVPNNWKGGRVWARTGCDGSFNCETGGCGNSEHCNGKWGATGPGLAEFGLDAYGGNDFYDVSLVDGFNVPLVIQPHGGSGECKTIGTNSWDILNDCPSALEVKKDNRRILCDSACTKFHKDEYCCTGSHSTSKTCGPTDYSKFFKKYCPTCYSYAYDDATSTFTCKNANYNVIFC